MKQSEFDALPKDVQETLMAQMKDCGLELADIVVTTRIETKETMAERVNAENSNACTYEDGEDMFNHLLRHHPKEVYQLVSKLITKSVFYSNIGTALVLGICYLIATNI